MQKWETVAKLSDMQVQFVYWGKHELSQFLQRDTPEIAGRVQYWFNETVLSKAQCEQMTNRSERALGERFSPEFHVDLPLNRVMMALGRTHNWYRHAAALFEQWSKAAMELTYHFSILVDDKQLIDTLKTQIAVVKKSSIHALKHKLLAEQSMDIGLQLQKVTGTFYALKTELARAQQSHNDALNTAPHNAMRLLNTTQSLTQELKVFLMSEEIKAAQAGNVLLYGEAGIGKSHLLCDIAINLTQANHPVVFCLGQRYPGGDPLNWIKNEMGLGSLSADQFLGALSASAEANDAQAMIIIDAINEGIYRDEWYGQLSNFIVQVSAFKKLSLVISCRSNFVELIVDDAAKKMLHGTEHKGFSGWEHRAAKIYLSRQGITLPGAPVMAPEFSNPLFLKTCCRALKQQGLNAFPKGLGGLSGLFDFYIESVEKILQRIKGYRRGELNLHALMNELAGEMFPDNMFGLAVSHVRHFFNQRDPRPDYGENLLELLISEGLLAEDVQPGPSGTRSQAIIRFTYERLSDFFIASQLISLINPDDIPAAFAPGGSLECTQDPRNLRGYSGMLNMASIIFAEHFNREFIDFIPQRVNAGAFAFRQLFTDTLIWRSGKTFTDRTLELFTTLHTKGSHSPCLDIMLRLSTEPLHPWNADCLHMNLKSYSLAERDAFWSTHLSVSDNPEGAEGEDTPLRTLIDWAQFGEISETEEERIRLAAVALMWMTSCTSRVIRDQASKSVLRLLVSFPALTRDVYRAFRDADDAYIRERLYGALYGTVISINNKAVIRNIADDVYDHFFAAGTPDVHLVMRDYARGIIEKALSQNCLSEQINIERCRPPYTSQWPLSIPDRDTVIAMIPGDKNYNAITTSVMGFPGDFGNYSMACVTQWSPASIHEGTPKTVGELKREFAESLHAPLQHDLITIFEREDNSNDIMFDAATLSFTVSEQSVASSVTNLRETLEAKLTHEQLEEWRRIEHLGRSTHIPRIDKKLAQLWVAARALSFGWSEERFSRFEQNHARYRDRAEPRIERMGKKYQRIALQEFLAHLADNCAWAGSVYSDDANKTYCGPWQLYQRDIDPSLPLRALPPAHEKSEASEAALFFGMTESLAGEPETWLWDEDFIIRLNSLLRAPADNDCEAWFNLRTYLHINQAVDSDDPASLRLDAWLRISSMLIHRADLSVLQGTVNSTAPAAYEGITISEIRHSFIREYPWHPSASNLSHWLEKSFNPGAVPVRHLPTVVEYIRNSGEGDYALTNSVSVYLPAKDLISGLHLVPDPDRVSAWQYNDVTVFYDPSEVAEGPSAGLIREEALNRYLAHNDLCLVWITEGEKLLSDDNHPLMKGRLNFHALHWLEGREIKSNVCFRQEREEE
ncbi:hypothetical protein K5Y32_22640 [Pantoea sp. DY-15]|uniref:hypothetical protein n=1 Tax=Pantoea sp. DY-15 TaxID=2871489 RepID=UPI001C95929E|nr:hypothetical protein [Pantoea sp. DY-15]MBY4890728.1 hypothetical protein [Pantoea sp. DY-15]